MMKIAYLGVYRDGTGYSCAAASNILSCETAGLDIVCRPVRLGNIQNIESCPIEHLEKKSLDNVDVIIQHILPHCFQYKHGVKNIGFFEIEADRIRKIDWINACNLMDEIWAPCYQNKKALEFSGIKVPVRVVPHAIGPIDKNHQEKLPLPDINEKCTFYTIGEFIKRKNYASLLRTYLSNFNYRDNVCLIIKTNVPGKNSEQSLQIVQKFINEIKNAICLYPKSEYYAPIYVITQRLNNQQIQQLHNSGTYFVSSSHGEAFNLGAAEALSYGKPCILSNYGGHFDLLSDNIKAWQDNNKLFDSVDSNAGWLIDGQLTPAFGMQEFSGNIYDGQCYWIDPSIEKLREKMTEAYNIWNTDKLVYQKMSMAAKLRAQQFSYEKIGQIIKNTLKN